MDCFRGATCFAMSISASMGVSGFERCFLESWRLLGKGPTVAHQLRRMRTSCRLGKRLFARS
jgi:hypothetical protein